MDTGWGIFIVAVTALLAGLSVALRRDAANRRAFAELEMRSAEIEAVIAAEPHVLLIWRGRGDTPERKVGSMHGSARVPQSPRAIVNFQHWLTPDSAEALDLAVRQLRAEGTPFNIGILTSEEELLEADGRTAGGLATLRLRPVYGERRDATALEVAARNLDKQVEQLNGVLNVLPMPVWLRNADGEIAWTNNAYEKAEIDPGKIQEQALGEGIAGYALAKAGQHTDHHIETYAATLEKLDTAIAIFGPDQRLLFHNAAFAALWPLDAEWLRSHPTDGEILDRLRAQRCIPEQVNYREWKSRHLAAYTKPQPQSSWYLPDGRTLRIVCEANPFGGLTYVYKDATYELQLESRYNEVIDVQRETLDNLDEGVARFGSDGRLKLYNPAFAQFWNFDSDLLAKEPHIDNLNIAEAAASAWEEVKYSITGLDHSRAPVTGNIATSTRVLHYETVPLPDGNTLLTFSDITDSTRMERALRERADALEAADRLKSQFLSNVSYEIRTPLTSILGFAESLHLGIAGPLSPRQKEYVQDIRQSSDDLKNIIDAIIDLSAIDAGAIELKLEEVDAATVIQAAATKFSAQIEKRDLTLNIEVAADAFAFTADQTRVEKVLSNLLSNAIGFSPIGAIVRMGVRKAGADLQFWVSDSGPGIEPEFQKQAFERFQSRPVSGGHRGPGLGLATVKSFVDLHGGGVSLISKPGQGTTVLCSFPISGPQPQVLFDDLRKTA